MLTASLQFSSRLPYLHVREKFKIVPNKYTNNNLLFLAECNFVLHIKIKLCHTCVERNKCAYDTFFLE